MARKPINLALQGGGAHGAYTWGVVDKILEADDLEINAITATSAGAMNAAVIAYGYHLDGPAGARAKLKQFWRAISDLKTRYGMVDTKLLDNIPYYTDIERMMSKFMMDMTVMTASPYQLNPTGANPLKDVLLEIIDFDALNTCKQIDLFINATNVRSGKVEVFAKQDLTVDHLLASACLPQMHHAVEINGEAYWDGGFMGNPSLWPLFYETDVADLLVIHINPIERPDIPRTPTEIANRINEITFNSALLKEMRAIAFVQKLIDEGWLNKNHQGDLQVIRFHAIRADEVLRDLSLSSKYDTGWDFLTELYNKGRQEAEKWQDLHLAAVGKKSTVDLRSEFLDV